VSDSQRKILRSGDQPCRTVKEQSNITDTIRSTTPQVETKGEYSSNSLLPRQPANAGFIFARVETERR
jgi:hypothetical protein